MRYPSWVHETEAETGKHTFRGSRRRHLTIERALYGIQGLLNWIGDAFPGYDLLRIPLEIAFGLNCNFPLPDIFRYVVWINASLFRSENMKNYHRIEVRSIVRSFSVETPGLESSQIVKVDE